MQRKGRAVLNMSRVYSSSKWIVLGLTVNLFPGGIQFVDLFLKVFYLNWNVFYIKISFLSLVKNKKHTALCLEVVHSAIYFAGQLLKSFVLHF